MLNQLFLFTIVPIIVTKSYHYPISPPQFDDPSIPVYLPPPIYQDEGIVIPTPSPTYLPPVIPSTFPPAGDDDDTVAILPPSNTYLPPSNHNQYLRVVNMSCIAGSSFKCYFRIEGNSVPVIEDISREQGCIQALEHGLYKIDITEDGSMMRSCGIKNCEYKNNYNMCLALRIPTLPGIRLPEDPQVTLQCTPQERVVMQTRHVRLGAGLFNTAVKARSANNIIATGGGQKDLKSRLYLLRKSPVTNVFDQFVKPDTIVHLGEELVLRAIINEGDGWQYSLIGPVIIRSVQSKRSVVLVQENGCRNTQMSLICPYQTRQLSPLDNVLQFRAFMFQDAPNKGDDMILTVGLQGCVNSQDCLKTHKCEEASSAHIQSPRIKRDLNNGSTEIFSNNNKYVTNLESKFVFKVTSSHYDEDEPLIDESFTNSNDFYKEWFFVFIMFVICLFCIVISFIVYKLTYNY